MHDPSNQEQDDNDFIRFDQVNPNPSGEFGSLIDFDQGSKVTGIKKGSMKGQDRGQDQSRQLASKRQTQFLPGNFQVGNVKLKKRTMTHEDQGIRYDQRATTPNRLEVLHEGAAEGEVDQQKPRTQADEQLLFLDSGRKDVTPRKNRLFSDEELVQPQPEIIALSDPREAPKHPSQHDDEDQILIFDNVDKTAAQKQISGVSGSSSSKIQVAQISTLTAKLKLKNKLKGGTVTRDGQAPQAPAFQKEIMDQFENKQEDSQQGEDSHLPEHLYKKTQSYDKSKTAGGDSQAKSMEELQSPTHQIPSGPYFSIGLNSAGIPSELLMENNLSPHYQQEARAVAIKMAIKNVCKTPILPYVFLLMIFDASITNMGTWPFLLFYFLVLCSVPPYLWYTYYKSAVQHEINYDNRQILKFDFGTERFKAVPRYLLQTGDLILLQKEEPFPANIVPFSVIDDDEIPTELELSDGSQKRLILHAIRESDIASLSGTVEYDQHALPLLSDESMLNFRMQLGENKIFGEIHITQADLCAPELHQAQGQTLAIVIQTTVNKHYTPLALRKVLLYEHLDTLSPRFTLYLLLLTSVILSFFLSIIGAVWAAKNKDSHKYISSAEIGYNPNFINIFIEHLLVYQGIVPVFLEIIRPLFPLIALYKFNRDVLLDGDRTGRTSTAESAQILENLGRLKFANYNAAVFNQLQVRVLKCYYLDKEPSEGKLWPCGNEEPQEQDDLNKEQVQQCLEKTLLGLPYGALTPQMAAVQQYCKLMKITQFSYTHQQRTILYGNEILKYYPLLLSCKLEDGSIVYLYEMPAEEEEEDDEDKEEEEEPEEDLNKLNEKVEKEKEAQAFRSKKHYFWVHQATKTSKWIKENSKLETFIELADEETLFFQYFQFELKELKETQRIIGKEAFKIKFVKDLPFEILEQLRQKLSPITCVMFYQAPRHDFHLLLDFNAAEVRQWIFSRYTEFDDDDPTLKHLKQYMHFYVWNHEDDVLEQINHLKGSMNTKTVQSVKNFKIQNNQYTIENKYIALVLNQRTLDISMKYYKEEFLDLLLMPSFVVGLGLRDDQLEELMKFQKSKAENQTILCLGCEREDVMLCQNNTARICLVDAPKNVFTDSCQVRLTNVNALSKMVLTHARQTHIRISHFILFQIYKSLIITMCEFFFSFYNGYSPSMLFTPSFHFMFETFFTSAFGFLLFSYYSDVNHYDIRRNAQAFQKCQQDYFFNKYKLILIFIDATYQGFIIFYIPASILQYANDQSGIIEGFYYISLVSFMTLLLTVLLQPYIYLSTVTKEQVWLFILNSVFCILVLMTTCSSQNVYTNIPQYVEHLNALLNSTKSIFIVCFLTAICLTPTVIMHQYITVCDPPTVNMIHNYKDEEEIDAQKGDKKKADDGESDSASLKNDSMLQDEKPKPHLQLEESKGEHKPE